MPGLEVRRLAREREADFLRLHDERHGAGWCRCIAWWVESWEGFGERSAEENARLRRELFRRGEHDGYLLYEGGEPVGWCQAGPRDRLAKLVADLRLEPDAGAWALSCFLVAPALRRRGRASFLLREVLADLRARGVRRVEAYPKREQEKDALELWNGPERMLRRAGFRFVRAVGARTILELELER